MNLKEDKYLELKLTGGRENTGGRDGISYYVAVYSSNIDKSWNILFNESTFITRQAIASKYGYLNEAFDEAYDELGKITFSRARARIALELYEAGERYEENIFTDALKRNYITSTDNDVQKMILKALSNIRRKMPQQYKSINLDVDGFCSLLKCEKKQYSYNAGLLLDDEYISYGMYEKQDLDDGRIAITSKGIRYLSQIETEKVVKHSTTNELDDAFFDLALSFAGTERELAESLATKVHEAGFKVFLDSFYSEHLWGKDLIVFFDDIYRKKSKYCVIFVSSEYNQRMWTIHERKSAQARALKERGKEYILPIKVDDSELPGMPPTICYLSLQDFDIEKIAEILIKKMQEI